MFKNMKKPILIGLICEVSLALLALVCLIVAAVFGKVGLVIGSAVVMLALLYIAGGFVMEHYKPGNKYFNWAIWFWNVFCVEWVWEAFCKDRFWNGFCIGMVYNRHKKWDTQEESVEYNDSDPLLRVEDLCQYFPLGKRRELHAVDHVSFEIKKGEVFGLVGESGCGKTTTGRSIIKIYDITGGDVYFKGKRICAGPRTYTDAIKTARKQAKNDIAPLVADTKANPSHKQANDAKIYEIKAKLQEVLAENREKIARAYYDQNKVDKVHSEKLVKELDEKYLPMIDEAKVSGDSEKLSSIKKEYRKYRHIAKNTKLVTQIQMIFQDPIASLDPRMTVRDIIAEGLVINGITDKEYINEKVYEILETVGLVREHADRYPHEFSGGQRQRIGIARAVVMQPEMIIADEPVSALDVSIQAQVINLLNDLRERLGLTILFIAHDLSVVKYFSDRIGVMYFGKMVELASSDELFKNPMHPYTKSLLSAIPLPDPIYEKQRTRLIYNPIAEHDYSVDQPSLREITPGHFVYCNDAEEAKYKVSLK